jgi:adenine-specific DNA-methyltransferase
MDNDFEKYVTELNSILIQPIDEAYKLTAVKNYRKKLQILVDSTFAEKYCDFIQDSKENGVVYTPPEISNYIIKNTILPEDIVNNPYIKIVDPACGSGNIIIPCFIFLRNIYTKNFKKINKKHNINLNPENLNKHIIDNNLFGFDLDTLALKVLIIDLFSVSEYVNINNFFAADFLISEISLKIDIFIGNPPYIGHKTVNKDYAKILKEKYKGIYRDKGDISYCFFKKAISILSGSGKLGFITSRYFIESPSGTELRKLLNRDQAIIKIVDFYGIRPFKGIGIDPAMIFMNFNKASIKSIEVIKPLTGKSRNRDEFIQSVLFGNGESYMHFSIKPLELNETGWILKREEGLNIVKKIEVKCSLRLSDISVSYQGIITGCDNAFVLDSETAETEKIEAEILKPWIKSSFIEKNQVRLAGNLLIYSDLISGEELFPNAIKYISNYRDKLIQRRECRTGAREWYMLQWGRKQDTFEREKIIFPYKSSSNRFAIDSGSYFSADVYSLVLNADSEISYEKLAFILNSKTYEFYFKSFAKKLGEKQYEYYPNNLMKLFIPVNQNSELLEEKDLFEFFGFTDIEIGLINEVY